MGNSLEPGSRAVQWNPSLAAMHLFPMKTGSSFYPALSTERQGQRLAIRVCRRGMAAREGQKQCPVHCSIWQEDTILSRRFLKVQKTKVWSSWRGPRRPELEEVCTGTNVLYLQSWPMQNCLPRDGQRQGKWDLWSTRSLLSLPAPLCLLPSKI